MVEHDNTRSSATGVVATTLRALVPLVGATTAVVVGDVFRALDAIPSEIPTVSFRQPTVAVALILLGAAAVALGASVTFARHRLTSGQLAAFLVTALVLLLAAWAFHQALWHLVFGHGHGGPSWLGQS